METLKGLSPYRRKEEVERRKRVRSIIPVLRRRLDAYRREPTLGQFAEVKALFTSLVHAHVNAPFD